MRRILPIVTVLLLTAPALAQEPVGCGKFKWPIDHERTLLAAAAATPSGTQVAEPLGHAYRVALTAQDKAALPVAASRASKPGSNAGFVRLPALPKAGTYRVTLAEGAWIDVVQDGKALKSGAFTGATGCAGVRKSVAFDLRAAPVIVEISGTSATAVSFIMTPN